MTPLKLKEELPFKIGQEVWYITARTKDNNYSKSQVRSYNAVLFDDGSGLTAFVRSVELYAWNLQDDGYSLEEVFATEEEAKEATKFFPVKFITGDEWEQAIGSNGEDGVKIEDCELYSCCSNLQPVRNLLYTCYSRNGLIKLDRDRLKSLVIEQKTTGFCFSIPRENYPPILKRIFEQLEID
jgi:hypothetical protein